MIEVGNSKVVGTSGCIFGHGRIECKENFKGRVLAGTLEILFIDHSVYLAFSDCSISVVHTHLWRYQVEL